MGIARYLTVLATPILLPDCTNSALRAMAHDVLKQLRGIRMFGILGWIVFGLVVGAIAKLVMPGKDPGGIIITMLLGIVGALLGGWIGRAMGLYGPQDAAGFFMALLGSIILLTVYRFTLGARGRTA